LSALHYWRSPRFWIAVAKFVITGVAFAIIARYVRPMELLQRLNKISPGFLVLSVALTVSQVPLVAIRWRLIARLSQSPGDHLPAPFKFAQIIWMSAFFNQFMPFIAGDALRVIYLRDAGASLRAALKSTVLDRGVAATVLLMMTPLATFTLSYAMASAAGLIWLSAVAITSLTTLGVVLAAAKPIAKLAVYWRIPQVLAETLLDMRQLVARPATCLLVVLLSLAVHGIGCVVFGLLARGEGLGLSPLEVMAVAPLILFVSFLPIAISGWGVREGFTVILLSKLGAAPEAALLLSVSFGIVMLVASLPGAALLPFTAWRRSGGPVEQLP
jgi:glycosyltransferase 2 family protein